MTHHWFIPDRAVEIGLSSHDAAFSITVVNIANILSRIVFGITTGNTDMSNLMVLVIYVFISGLNTLLVPIWTSYWPYMFFAGLYGILRGLFVIYELLVLYDLVGKTQVGLSLGLIYTLSGIIFVIFIPVFGHYNEVTQSYTLTFILYGSLETIGGIFLSFIPIHSCWERQKINEI